MKGNLFYLTEKLVLKPFACIGVTQLVAGASKGKLWVGGCETLQCRAGCRTGPPTLVHTTAPAPAYCTGDRTGTPCIIVRRTARRDAGDVWAAEETAGSRRHTHGGI